MKTKIRLTFLLLLLSVVGSNAQTFSFNAINSRDHTVGVERSFESEQLDEEIVLIFKNKILSATKENGKKWMKDTPILRVIPFKKMESNESYKMIEHYFLEYKDESGLITYATYKKFIQGLGSTEILETLTIPIILENDEYVFKYREFLSY